MKYIIALGAALASSVASKLIIQSPQRLVDLFPPELGPDKIGLSKKLGIIRASYANFGFIPYGHNMVSNFWL